MTQIKKNRSLSGELTQLLSSVDHIQQLKEGDTLFAAGDLVKELYIVESGSIQIGKTTNDGREIALRICREGDIVGEVSIYQDNVKYLLTATALEDSEVSVIKKDDLEEALSQNNRLAIEFIKLISEMSLRDQSKIRDLVMYGRKGALFSTLIRLSNSYGKEIDDGILINLKLTDQELANFCGTSRESINRLLSGLKKEAVISNDKGYIIIHDIDHLKKEINCDECPVVICSIH